MKKLFFATISLVALSFLSANAAGDDKKEVNLSIKLHLIQSLQVNDAQTNVLLEYKTKENYANGVSVTENNHLSVYSTGGFVITAQSTSDAFEGPKPFSTNTVELTATNGSGQQEEATYSPVALSNSPTTLISSTVGGIDRKFHVTYAGAKNNTYINHFDKKAPNPNEYKTVVTYTITPQ